MVKKTIGLFREAIRERNAIIKAATGYFLMVLSIFLLAKFISSILPKDSNSIILIAQKGIASLMPLIVISLAYYLITLFIFSTFKIAIFSIVEKKSITKNTFSNLGGFFIFNIIQFSIVACIFFVVGAILSYTFSQSQSVSLVYTALFAFFAYPFSNLSQIEYLNKLKIFGSMKSGLKCLFSEFGHYVRMIITNIIYFIILIIFFLVFGSIYKAIVADQTSMIYVTVYNTLFIAATSILMLLIAAYNLYFFAKISKA